MFFSLNFRSRTLLPPRRDLWKRRRCWSRHRRGTDRPQPLLWQPLRNRVVRWYFMSVAEWVHLRSNGLQCNELSQGLLKFNWPITAFVRSEDGCSKIVDGPGCVRWTVSIDELSNQSMNTSISQKPKSWISLLITPASLFHVLSSGVSPLECLATQSTLQPCFFCCCLSWFCCCWCFASLLFLASPTVLLCFFQDDFGYAVTKLIFLNERPMSASSAGANLVSCNASGWVRTRKFFPFQVDAHIWTSKIIVIYRDLKETAKIVFAGYYPYILTVHQ